MGMRKIPHNAVYGDIVIPRGYCLECESYAFIIDGKLKCCDAPAESNPTTFKRMCDVGGGRKRPRKKVQNKILEEQRYLCFYCWRRFGQTVYREGRSIRLKINWDHVNPWSYCLSNKDSNFVAACHVCNGIKSNLMFKDLDDARTTITERWKDKGYSDVPPMSIRLRRNKGVAEVLHESVPSESMVQ
jgi:hypothetical protein